MEFKPHEIALMALGIAAPTILLVLGFIPGGLSFIGDIALNPRYMPLVFSSAERRCCSSYGYRIYRRIRPAQKKTTPSEETPHVTPTPKFSLRRDKPPEQQG